MEVKVNPVKVTNTNRVAQLLDHMHLSSPTSVRCWKCLFLIWETFVVLACFYGFALRITRLTLWASIHASWRHMRVRLIVDADALDFLCRIAIPSPSRARFF